MGALCCPGNKPPPHSRLQNEPVELPTSSSDSLKRHVQPSGKFSYLPKNYSKPRFDEIQSRNNEANETAENIKSFFTEIVVVPRQKIDDLLISFKDKTGKTRDASLPMCFQEWRYKANTTPDGSRQRANSMIEMTPSGDKVKKIRYSTGKADSETQRLAVQEIEDDMNQLLDSCHKFVDDRESVRKQLEEEIAKFSKYVNDSMKTKEMKKEMDTLVPELEELVRNVEYLLTDVSAAATDNLDDGLAEMEASGVFFSKAH